VATRNISSADRINWCRRTSRTCSGSARRLAPILCGDSNAPKGSPAHRGVVNLLADGFGTVVNEKGYRNLEPHVGAIYGDSMTSITGPQSPCAR
jgi:hypothetical protein